MKSRYAAGERRDATAMRDWIFSRVSPEPNTGCWLWCGYVNEDGYGRTARQHQGPKEYIHRLSYLAFRGPLPQGKIVLHSCVGMPCCANPDHLRPGTPAENVEDRQRQGRTRAASWRQVLTAEQVRTIRSLHAAGASLVALSKRFGVGREGIKSVVYRKTWRAIQ